MISIIGLDLDSVIGDTNTALVKYLKEEHSFDLDLSTMFDYKIERYPGISAALAEVTLEDIHNGKILFSILPFDYTAESINKLYGAGFKVVIITSRPYYLNEMTIEWLNIWSLKYDNIYYIDTAEKYKIINKLGIKAFVDDRYEAIDGIAGNCGALEHGLYLVKYPWNRHYTNKYVTKVNTLLNAVDKIINKVVVMNYEEDYFYKMN